MFNVFYLLQNLINLRSSFLFGFAQENLFGFAQENLICCCYEMIHYLINLRIPDYYMKSLLCRKVCFAVNHGVFCDKNMKFETL